jgi:hypothetical protein
MHILHMQKPAVNIPADIAQLVGFAYFPSHRELLCQACITSSSEPALLPNNSTTAGLVLLWGEGGVQFDLWWDLIGTDVVQSPCFPIWGCCKLTFDHAWSPRVDFQCGLCNLLCPLALIMRWW